MSKPPAEEVVGDLDLDALERKDAPPLFSVVLEGERYVFADPQAIVLADLAELGDGSKPGVGDLVASCIVIGDRKAFVAALARIPSWKVDAFFAAYNGHFGIDARTSIRYVGGAS